MEYKDGSIYADGDGCLLVCIGDNQFIAFGNSRPIHIDELTGQDTPVVEVITNEGDVLVSKVEYTGGTNTREATNE